MKNCAVEDCFHLGIKALICSNEGKLLLLKKEHRTRGTFWDLPGGRLQKGETVLEALQREVEEETGFKHLDGLSPFDMVLTEIRIPTPNGEVGLVLFLYHCPIGDPFEPRLSAEHTDFDWVSFPQAAEWIKTQYPSACIEKIASMKITHAKNLDLTDNLPTSLERI